MHVRSHRSASLSRMTRWLQQRAAVQQWLHGELTLIIDALRSACLSMVPYLVLVALLTLAEQLLGLRWQHAEMRLEIMLQQMFSLVLLLTFSYHLSVRYDVHRGIAIVLVLVSAISAQHINKSGAVPSGAYLSADVWLALAIPILSIRLFALYGALFTRLEGQLPRQLWADMAQPLRMVMPFIFSMLSVLVLSIIVDPLFHTMQQEVQLTFNQLSNQSFMFIRMLLAHAIWMLGLHGDNLLGLIYDTSVLFQPMSGPVDLIGFYNLFVLHGGCGAAWCLWLAVLLGADDRHARRVAWFATPFLLFNIPEILIFGLPVVLNPTLFWPFMLVPLLNFCLGVAAVGSGWVQFQQAAPAWTTPVLFNSYIATGSWQAPFVQLTSLLLGTLIYLPFVKRFAQSQSSSSQLNRLESSLNISSSLQARSGLQFHTAQSSIIHSHQEVDRIIQLLQQNQLEVHYQPKMNLITGDCHQAEALLRLRLRDNSLKGPFFLDVLEQAGLASTIDIWVCRQVKQDLQCWHEQGFHPHIAVNLHPQTIANTWYIEHIAAELAGYAVDFEIIERADAGSNAVLDNLRYLRQLGFGIALDDFGSGYAGFAALNLLPLSVVKLDKSLLDAALAPNTSHANPHSSLVYQHAASMCHTLGLATVAEGVETQAQLALVQHAGIGFVQGYLLSKPVPAAQFPHVRPANWPCSSTDGG